MKFPLTRRNFIRKTALTVLGLSSINIPLFCRKKASPDDRNAEICIKKFSFAVDNGLAGGPIGDVVASIGESFIGTAYRENALEEEGEEHLVVDLEGLDCVTFCEVSLALARCVNGDTMDYAAFCRQLKYIRYRGGILDRYPSRLHYFSDWIFDNGKKGVVRNVTAEIGGPSTETVEKKIDFMTAHRDHYRQLANDEFFRTVAETEKEISSRPITFILKERIGGVAAKIGHGDIIAVTTAIEGIDISHTGIAFRKKDGSLHLLHAPVPGSKVQITESTLHEYCAKNKKQTGILIARPLETARK